MTKMSDKVVDMQHKLWYEKKKYEFLSLVQRHTTLQRRNSTTAAATFIL